MNQEKRNIMLYTAGKAVSILGSSIYAFVISLYVLKITGSALNFATTLMLSVVPMVVISPFAGVIADRLPKKWLVVGMDFANGLLFAVIFWYANTESLTLATIYISTVILNIFTTFFSLGLEAAKPSLVSPEKLVRLNSLSKLIDSSAAILGPVIGGIVFALVDIRLFILLNALSFAFSGFTECFIDYHLNHDQWNESDALDVTRKYSNTNRFFKELSDGWQFFSKNQSILELFFVFVSLNFLLGFSVNVPAPYIINQVLKLPSSSFGIINSMFPVGLILGTLTVEWVMKKVAFRKLLISMNAFIAVLAAFVGFPVLLQMNQTSNLLYYSVMNILMGIAIAYVDVPIMTIMQTEIPQKLLGRVMSLIMSLVKLVLPIALITSGFLLNVMPIVILPILGASVAFFYSIYLLTVDQGTI